MVVLGLSCNTSSLVWCSLNFICVICHRQIKKTVGRLTDKRDLHLKRINRKKVVFYRPQTKFAKVMCLQVSVCPQGEHMWQGVCMAGEGMCGRGTCMAGGDMHGSGVCMAGGWHAWHGGHGGHAWQEGCVAGGMHGRGACVPQQILWDTVNERMVRIILECILVLHIFIVETHTSKVSVHWNFQSGTHPS